MSSEQPPTASDPVNHPAHYGGGDNPYEVIKVITAWGLDFSLGNAVKYIARAGKKTSSPLEDLKKARFYLDHVIKGLEPAETPKQIGVTTHDRAILQHPICINCRHTHYYESGDKTPLGKCRTTGCKCDRPEYASPD